MRKIIFLLSKLLPICLIIFFILVALAAPWLAPQKNPNQPQSFLIIGSRFDRIPHPPNNQSILGTLPGQFDVYFTLIWGTREALKFAIIVVLMSSVFGTIVGAISGYVGGRTNSLILRITDAFLTFPPILAIVVLYLFLNIYTSIKLTGTVPAPGNQVVEMEMNGFFEFFGGLLSLASPLMVSLILFGWMPYTRILNDQILIVKQKEFVLAARAIGNKPFGLIFKHILPNSIAPVIVTAARDIGGVIVLQSSFTFIGFGGNAPWAEMLAIGRNWIIGPKSNPFASWWVFLPATLVIVTFGVAWNLFGDVINDLINPRSKNI